MCVSCGCMATVVSYLQLPEGPVRKAVRVYWVVQCARVDIDMLLSFRRHRVISRASTISRFNSMRVRSTRPHRFSSASPPRKTCITGVWLAAALETPAVTDTSPSTTATAAISTVAIACGRWSTTLHRSRREQAGFGHSKRTAQNESTAHSPTPLYTRY